MEIVDLDAALARAHGDALAQLLLDAHASGMALVLAAPLTRERARAEWLRLVETAEVVLAAVDGGEVVGAVSLARAGAENGRHRAEVQRLAVRGDRRGGGVGRTLLAALVERARTLGLELLWLTTHAETPSDAFYVRQGWTRAGVVPSWSQRPDGTLAANAFFYLVL
ncbi:MAG TPA: GNAT family N-acetyltransferase [Gaiellaceae bacterium]|nr:GNAT family N-acetyltransferase [Gaiellaceae bacterium]